MENITVLGTNSYLGFISNLILDTGKGITDTYDLLLYLNGGTVMEAVSIENAEDFEVFMDAFNDKTLASNGYIILAGKDKLEDYEQEVSWHKVFIIFTLGYILKSNEPRFSNLKTPKDIYTLISQDEALKEYFRSLGMDNEESFTKTIVGA